MPGRRGKYCVAGFSQNRSCRNSSLCQNISMHKFPTGEKQRRTWTNFVRRHRPSWEPTSSSCLCSAHFLGSDFNQRVGIDVPEVDSLSTGSIECKKFLIAGTIPTVDDFEIASKSFPPTTSCEPTSSTTPCPPKNSANNRTKRKLLRELSSFSNEKRRREGEHSTSLVQDEIADTPYLLEAEPEDIDRDSDTSTVKTPTFEDSNQVKDLKFKLKTSQQRCYKYNQTILRLQQKLKIVNSKTNSVQGNGHGVQAEYSVACGGNNEDHDMATTNHTDGHLNIDESEMNNYLEEVDDMLDMDETDEDWNEEECDLQEDADDGEDDTHTDSKNRVRFDPATPVEDEPKFIVFLSCLLSLFSLFCFHCKSSKPQVDIKKNGTMVTIEQQCQCCKEAGRVPFKWHSQPFIFGRHPAGNLLLSFAILVAGASVSKVLLVFSHMHVSVYSARTFFLHQRKYLFPTVIGFFESTRSQLISQVKAAKETVWTGDGRFDSMGHYAKYGAYSMMSSSIGKIVHFEILQSNETGSSQGMELEGAKRAFGFLSSSGIGIETFVSDRHRGIAKWIRMFHPAITHFFDIWHVSKSVTKKLTKLAREKDCELVADWIKPIRNHLYWCACSTKPGYGKLIIAKWKSYCRHISNMHHDHPDPLYTKCGHGELSSRRWIRMGTHAYDRVLSICDRTDLINDIGKLSCHVQTSQLEAFHATLNQFHPKMVCFSYTGTYCRHALAVLHYNENVKREAKKAKDGSTYLSIRYPKYKNGEELVRVVPVAPTYDYVEALRKALFEMERKDMEEKARKFRESIPGPLCSAFEDKLEKDSAVKKFMERKQKSVQLFPSLDEQEALEMSCHDETTSQPPRKQKKAPHCKKCSKPMRGHPRGKCA